MNMLIGMLIKDTNYKVSNVTFIPFMIIRSRVKMCNIFDHNIRLTLHYSHVKTKTKTLSIFTTAKLNTREIKCALCS